MSTFEAFRWNFLVSTNLKIERSVLPHIYTSPTFGFQLPNVQCSSYEDYKVRISSTISPVYDLGQSDIYLVILVVDRFYVIKST